MLFQSASPVKLYIPGSSVRDLFVCFIRDHFRGENVTSIWEIKRSRMEEAGVYKYIYLRYTTIAGTSPFAIVNR